MSCGSRQWNRGLAVGVTMRHLILYFLDLFLQEMRLLDVGGHGFWALLMYSTFARPWNKLGTRLVLELRCFGQGQSPV